MTRPYQWYVALGALFVSGFMMVSAVALFLAAIWSNNNELEENFVGTGIILLIVGFIGTCVNICILDDLEKEE